MLEINYLLSASKQLFKTELYLVPLETETKDVFMCGMKCFGS